jgi:hypothetical protein
MFSPTLGSFHPGYYLEWGGYRLFYKFDSINTCNPASKRIQKPSKLKWPSDYLFKLLI